MNLHEYQAKLLFSDYDIPVPPGKTAYSLERNVKRVILLADFFDLPLYVRNEIYVDVSHKYHCKMNIVYLHIPQIQ